MRNQVLEKFQNGEPTYGTFSHMKSTVAIENLGATDLDYVLVDMEHNAVTIDEMTRYIIAANASGIEPFIRVCEGRRDPILHALDIGAKGIIIPNMQTVEQVKKVVEYGKFFPLGNRGYCPSRDDQWGLDPSYATGMTGYFEESNAKTLLIPQCETMGCLQAIEEVAAIDGVDGIMIGPNDLSIAMGIPGQFAAPEFQAAVQRVVEACHTYGKMAFIFTTNAADTKRYVGNGFDSVIMGVDTLSLIRAFNEMLQDVKEK